MIKSYAETKAKSNVAKSPNMAMSGVTGKGDYPVKPAVVKTGEGRYEVNGKIVNTGKLEPGTKVRGELVKPKGTRATGSVFKKEEVVRGDPSKGQSKDLVYEKSSGRARGFTKESYNSPESIAKRKKADAEAERKRRNKKYDLGIFN